MPGRKVCESVPAAQHHDGIIRRASLGSWRRLAGQRCSTWGGHAAALLLAERDPFGADGGLDRGVARSVGRLFAGQRLGSRMLASLWLRRWCRCRSEPVRDCRAKMRIARVRTIYVTVVRSRAASHVPTFPRASRPPARGLAPTEPAAPASRWHQSPQPGGHAVSGGRRAPQWGPRPVSPNRSYSPLPGGRAALNTFRLRRRPRSPPPNRTIQHNVRSPSEQRQFQRRHTFGSASAPCTTR